jgi:hypothetical protein
LIKEGYRRYRSADKLLIFRKKLTNFGRDATPMREQWHAMPRLLTRLSVRDATPLPKQAESGPEITRIYAAGVRDATPGTFLRPAPDK